MAISSDPIEFNAGDANLYRYVGNQATTHTDPSGLQDIMQGELDLERSRRETEHPMQADPAGSESGVLTISSRHVMGILGFRRYETSLPFGIRLFASETTEYSIYKQGCKGLASLRMNLAGREPFSLPGTRAFKTLDAALAAQKEMIKTTPNSHRVVIWVYQSERYLNKQFDYMLLPNSETEYDCEKVGAIRGPIPNLERKGKLRVFDFVTVHQNEDLTVRFYETMDFGVSLNPDLFVKHKVSLYPPEISGTVYFVVAIPDHPRAPMSPLGQGK